MFRLSPRTALLGALLTATAVPAMAQDASLNPTFGSISLRSGFLEDPSWVHVLAGGSTQGHYNDVANSRNCAGYFAGPPDFRMTFEPDGTSPLSITAFSYDDTVLLVNGPSGEWNCNDDTYGLNSAITFDAPQAGVYNIWVGTYGPSNGEYPPAELGFTQSEPFEAQILRSFFGRDDRLVMNPLETPWSMVGLVELSSGRCSGTLIGPSTVLTAGHCIANLGQQDTPPVTFRAGFQNGAAVAEAGVTHYHIPAPWRSNEQEGYDFALFYLDQPLGNTLGWMDVGPLTPTELAGYASGVGHDILKAGYSSDRPDVLTGNLDCPFVELGQQNTLVHQCDTVQGDSGSPLFIQTGDRYRIIGVESYTSRRPELEFDINVAMYSANIAAELQLLSGTVAASAAPAPAVK